MPWVSNCRCFASMAMLEGLYGHEQLIGVSVMDVCGGFFMETHNQCWGAWAAMGGNYIPEPENAKLLRDAAVRDKLIRYFATFYKHDEIVAMLLEEATNTPFFMHE